MKVLRVLVRLVVPLLPVGMMAAAAQSPSQEALDLLTAQVERADVVVTVSMENGVYRLRYDISGGRTVCLADGSVIVPVNVPTDIQVTSQDRIVR